MSGFELRTERLVLREWRDDDLEPMVEVNSHPQVYEFLARVPDRELTIAGIERASEHFAEYGYCHFAVEATEGDLAGRLLGFCGVSHPSFVPAAAHRPELGYRFGRFAWGRGYATEAALAARDDAFSRCRLPELISLIDPRNTRSQSVAERGGFEPAETLVNPLTGLDLVVWTRGGPS